MSVVAKFYFAIIEKAANAFAEKKIFSKMKVTNLLIQPHNWSTHSTDYYLMSLDASL